MRGLFLMLGSSVSGVGTYRGFRLGGYVWKQ